MVRLGQEGGECGWGKEASERLADLRTALPIRCNVLDTAPSLANK